MNTEEHKSAKGKVIQSWGAASRLTFLSISGVSRADHFSINYTKGSTGASANIPAIGLLSGPGGTVVPVMDCESIQSLTVLDAGNNILATYSALVQSVDSWGFDQMTKADGVTPANFWIAWHYTTQAIVIMDTDITPIE